VDGHVRTSPDHLYHHRSVFEIIDRPRRLVLATTEHLPQPPYVPGLEVAGTVRELGEGVDGLTVGEPVVTLSGTGAVGGYAEIEAVDARFVVSVGSSGVDPALAVAAVPNAATAYLVLTQIAHFQAGETVLVHGALGGWRPPFPASRVASAPRGLSGPSARRVSRSPRLRDCPMTD
jgi:NADPH:quinone reductase